MLVFLSILIYLGIGIFLAYGLETDDGPILTTSEPDEVVAAVVLWPVIAVVMAVHVTALKYRGKEIWRKKP